MTFALDHVVIAVADLDRAIADYRQLGFTVIPGGVHHGGVSHNALVVFADGSYFELIAYLKAAPDVRWWQVLSRAGEGLVDFALSPENTLDNLRDARVRGLELTGPIDGGRERPDGVRLDWQIVRPATHDLPFWCGDVTPRHLRVPEGEMRRHANGVTGIAVVTVAVRDVAVSAARYAALIGDAAVTHSERGATVQFNGAVVELVADAARVETRSEGPLALLLRGDVRTTPDASLTHGAAITIAP